MVHVDLECLYEFCFKRNTWTLVPWNGDAPTRRREYEGFLYRDHFYVFGGNDVSTYKPVENAFIQYEFGKLFTADKPLINLAEINSTQLHERGEMSPSILEANQHQYTGLHQRFMVSSIESRDTQQQMLTCQTDVNWRAGNSLYCLRTSETESNRSCQSSNSSELPSLTLVS
ncbi:Kelch-type beta propeller [Phytophthora cactorum]|nr:Kelch-type beta propeller [Phytophthora cactorum]